ncbi:hypothetical protein KIW84_013276 [Lathyrus oleraceus]|uniref:cytokinin riboside 5'-monophosphate phosphoribohydrolase n=1 Tax=Pisum sativum TaxID=3888 RepID=A0A9D5BJX6_PEA|nr:hypothetical protein KIW84_013276 [Pisum sativum]
MADQQQQSSKATESNNMLEGIPELTLHTPFNELTVLCETIVDFKNLKENNFDFTDTLNVQGWNAFFERITDPVGLLNVDGYYNFLLSLFDNGVEEGFIKPGARNIVFSASSSKELMMEMEVGLLNVDGYYNFLLSLFDNGVEEGFIKPGARNIVFSASSSKELMMEMESYSPFHEHVTPHESWQMKQLSNYPGHENEK